MKNPSYVLITPARNEQGTIGITIESVIKQTKRPTEWVIVSDGSTDDTDAIVKAHAAKHDFIKLLRLEKRPLRSFSSFVFATESGIAALKTKDYDFIGLLDADIRYPENYYEEMLKRFASDPKLGLAGGNVVDCYGGRRYPSAQAVTEVAGAVQLFRRTCFESLGGLVAIPEGGSDTISSAQARMHGFKTQMFPEIEVDHLKPRNISAGNIFQRTWQLGVREYALGYHPLFELLKCAYRCKERPFLIGGFLRFAGYAQCCLKRKQRMLPVDVLRFIRQEQMARLFRRGSAGA